MIGRGCVQEEIRFAVCAELLVCRLFTERLGPRESLRVDGAERFCEYSGYANSFRFGGDHRDPSSRFKLPPRPARPAKSPRLGLSSAHALTPLGFF